MSDLDEEEDYPEQNVRATYAKAKFARIRPITEEQSVQIEIGIPDVFFSNLSHSFLEFFSNLNLRRFGRGAVL